MIETASALENLDDILAVPGVDAIYIGPMDLSLSLGLAPKPDRDDDEVYSKARQRILDACRRHGVAAGIHAGSRTAAQRVADGFQFVLVSSDVDLLARNAARELRSARESAAGSSV
jgi:4-hydroxy-2-oxoheptanedioate aldolase